MNAQILSATLLLGVVLSSNTASADLIDLSEVEVTAFASFESQRVPKIEDFDEEVAPPDQLLMAAQVLVLQGQPFPNVPNSQNSGFASSAATIGGVFGVGVNGFFLQNSLPPNDYVATGTWTRAIINNSTDITLGASINFNIPTPTIQFFGVGNSFPAGADPLLDATAEVNLRLISTLTHANGDEEETIHLDYGMHTFRDPSSGVLLAIPTNDAIGELHRFDEPDGSFGFQLTTRTLQDFSLGEIGPGDTFEFGYEYLARASTGFGETAVFAAIGDPFDLTLGSPLALHLSEIPEPGTLALLAWGVASLGATRRARVQRFG